MDWLTRVSPAPRLVGQMPAPAGWIEQERVIYDHELVFFSGSDFAVSIDEKTYECRDGDFIIVPPGHPHATVNTGRTEGTRAWVHFSWEAQANMDAVPIETYYPMAPEPDLYVRAPAYVPGRIFRGTIHDRTVVTDLYRRMFYRWNLGDRHEQLTVRALLLELLIELLDGRDAAITSSRPAHLLAYRVRRAIESMVQLYPIQRQNLSVQLEGLGYSYEHLCREFKATYGFPPTEYLTRYRIANAKQLLSDTTFTISEIAYRLGFSRTSYFSNVFKRRVGRSPTSYRKVLGYP